jgi:RNA polymerase sigma factor (sigma-70 family)
MARTQLENAFRHLRELLQESSLEPLSDAELLERFISKRDEAAFTLLVHRHGRLVWSVCRQILHHEQDAEDAYQASFLVLVRHASTIRRGQSVACWLYRVASRIARKLARDRLKRRECEAKTSPSLCGQVLQDVNWRELQGLLQEELMRLPQKYQAPFILCCLEGMTKSEAARHLRWKEGTLSSRLAHARRRIQQHLTRRGVTLATIFHLTENFLRKGASPSLAKSTVRAAGWVLAGKSLSGMLSPEVTVLMHGAMKMIISSKIKFTLAVLLVTCLFSIGAGALAWQRSSAASTHQEDARLVAEFANGRQADSESPPASDAKRASKSWIGIASRETNAGPEVALLFEDGRRQRISAAADTVLLSYLADSPLGSHEVLSIDLADTNRILVRFDLPRGGRVKKAELLLARSQSRHPTPAEPVTLALHQVSESWDEGRVTWNRQPAFNRRPALTAQIDPADREYRIDVTTMVRRTLEERGDDHGWLLRIATPLGAEPSGVVADGTAPQGWTCNGQDYAFAVDSSVRHVGKYSCRIESVGPRPTGAMMSQAIRAEDYRGQRVRYSGFLKTESLEGMATLWMRIDGENELLAIDKTIQQAVRGTSGWRKAEIVLDVPADSKSIRFAILVEGTGKAWIDGLNLEVVERSVPVTNPSTKGRKPELPRRPVNLNFEGVPGG